MDGVLQRLKQRKLVQWAAAYLAAAWVLLQVLDLASGSYHWPDAVMHIAFGVLAVGFAVVLILAWYHGERGVQRVSGMELLIVALVLAVGGGLLWHFAQAPAAAAAVAGTARSYDSATCKSGPCPDNAAACRSGPCPRPAAEPQDPSVAAGASAAASASPMVAQAIPAKSVAVLPFENLSTDKGNAYFADGMQDLILTKLADIGDLKVISRTSTMQYGAHPQNLTLVGQQLGVATILEGSVQKAGNQVLINVQLIDAKTDAHLWAQSYQRTLDNIFGVEGEVAGKVADALKAKLTQAESATVTNVPTRDPAAFDDYLRGEHYISMSKAGNFKVLPKAVEAYRAATEADPRFALAWARLAFAQGMLNYASIDVSPSTGQQALANAKRALALAPNLPQAHLALGYVYRFDLHDYDQALAEFRLARQGLPNDAEVEAAIAYIEALDNASAAAAGLERAVLLDPRDPNLANSLGEMYMELREYDKAGAAFNRVLAIAPDDPEGYSALARVLVLQHGDVTAALAELAKAPAALQTDSEIVYGRVRLLLLKRDYPAALKAVATLQPGGRFVTPATVAGLRAKVNHFAGNAAEARKDFEQTLALARDAVQAGATGDAYQIAYAKLGLGDKQAAIQAAQQLRESALRSKNRETLYAGQYAMALIDATYGDAGPAVSALDGLFASPATGAMVSVPLLKLDPTWDPIRNDPAFQALLKKYGSAYEPATASGGVGHD